MYFHPGKTKTYTRTFNKVRASVFAEKQLSLLAAVGSAEGFPRPYNNRGKCSILEQKAICSLLHRIGFGFSAG